MTGRRLLLLLVLAGSGLIGASWAALEATSSVDRTSAASRDGQSRRMDLEALTNDSDLLVRGRVVGGHSFQSGDNGLIETDTKLRVRYTAYGTASDTTVVRTLGGFLPDEGVGMGASGQAEFTVGDEVLVFLRTNNHVHRVAGGALGAYRVSDGVAVNQASGERASLTSLYQDTLEGPAGASVPASLPADWEAREGASVDGEAADEDLALQAQGSLADRPVWGGPNPMGEPYLVNVNTTQAGSGSGTEADFLNAIIASGDVWSDVPSAHFSFTYGGSSTATDVGLNGLNEVMFINDAAGGYLAVAYWWFNWNPDLGRNEIYESDMAINDVFLWDATGSPDATQYDLQTTVIHEFGHWLSLGHDEDPGSVMFWALDTAFVQHELHQNDVDGITFLYPPAPTPTVTATPTATPSVTPTPTATATGTPPPPPASGIDTGGDGCDDALEQGSVPSQGGLRDPNFVWDFFDTPDASHSRDGVIAAADIMRIVGRFGTSGNPAGDPLAAPPAIGYHTAFDRSPQGQFSGPPDGDVSAADISLVVAQFGHICAGTN